MIKSHQDAVMTLPSPILIDIAGTLVSGSDATQSSRDFAMQLIHAASKQGIGEHDLSRAAFILISLGAFPAVVSLSEATAAANPSWAKDGRLLSLRAGTLLNAAIRAGNFVRDVALTPSERDGALRSFEELTARAVNLFTCALSSHMDEQEQIGARRGLDVIKILKSQTTIDPEQHSDRDV
jgi:hypothetical protein